MGLEREGFLVTILHHRADLAEIIEFAGAYRGQTGADVSRACVHKDPLSQQATHAMRARAFAHGGDVFLGPGESELDAMRASGLSRSGQCPTTTPRLSSGSAR